MCSCDLPVGRTGSMARGVRTGRSLMSAVNERQVRLEVCERREEISEGWSLCDYDGLLE